MILTCPECKTRYLVNPAQLRPAGRVVRCAKCGAAWKEEAPVPEPDEVAPPPADEQNQNEAEAAPSTYERPVRVKPLPRGSNLPALHQQKKTSGLLGWITLVAFVALVLGSGYFFRSFISTAWPPSKKLYNILDLDTTPPPSPKVSVTPARKLSNEAATGLVFKNLVATPHYDGNILILTFQGTIENPTGDAILPTLVTAVAKDENGANLKKWSFSIDPHAIPGHGSTTFSTELRDAPPETRRVIPTFATAP